MAHFAQLDENNRVIQVIVVNDDYLRDGYGNEVEELGRSHLESVHGGTWVQTSYNSRIRKRYAGIGYTYDNTLDAFLTPKPFDSWVLNQVTLEWDPPIPYPGDGQSYTWDESTQSWVVEQEAANSTES